MSIKSTAHASCELFRWCVYIKKRMKRMSNSCFFTGNDFHLSITAIILGARLGIGLGQTDAVHKEPNTALGDNVRDCVSHLHSNHGIGCEAGLALSGARQHGESVHDWVCAPREDSSPACPLHCLTAPLGLRLLGVLEADEQSVDDVAEGDHGQSPEAPTSGWIGCGLTRVSVDDHGS